MKEESVEKDRNCSLSKACLIIHHICETWWREWYGLSVYGFYWNGLTCLRWCRDSWQLTAIAVCILKNTAYLLRYNQMPQVLLLSGGRWPQTTNLGESNQSFSGPKRGKVSHPAWVQLDMSFTCWRQDWGYTPEANRNGCRPGRASPGKIPSIWSCLWDTGFRQLLIQLWLCSFVQLIFFP